MKPNNDSLRISKIRIRQDEQLIHRLEADIQVLNDELSVSNIWDDEDSIIEEAIYILLEAKRAAELRVFEGWHSVIQMK